MINDKKDNCKVSFRCSLKEKEILKRNADKNNLSLSEYVLNSALVRDRSRKKKDKQRMIILTERTELLNRIGKEISKTNDNKLVIEKELLEKIIEGEYKIWEN